MDTDLDTDMGTNTCILTRTIGKCWHLSGDREHIFIFLSSVWRVEIRLMHHRCWPNYFICFKSSTWPPSCWWKHLHIHESSSRSRNASSNRLHSGVEIIKFPSKWQNTCRLYVLSLNELQKYRACLSRSSSCQSNRRVFAMHGGIQKCQQSAFPATNN